jgi:hypothetical protein
VVCTPALSLLAARNSAPLARFSTAAASALAAACSCILVVKACCTSTICSSVSLGSTPLKCAIIASVITSMSRLSLIGASDLAMSRPIM